MLRNQKIFSDDEHSKSDTESEPKPTQSATNQSQKPKLMHTYSNLSDKSSAANSEPPHSVRTTLVQMEFVKSSFTVNPCMVSTQPRLIQKKTIMLMTSRFIAELTCAPFSTRRRQIVHQSRRQFAKSLSQLQIISTRSKSDGFKFVHAEWQTRESFLAIVQYLHGQLYEWRVYFGAEWR